MVNIVICLFAVGILTQKAQTSCCLLAVRGLRITHLINKQQETYAGMKTHCTIQAQYGYNHTHRHLLLLWLY